MNLPAFLTFGIGFLTILLLSMACIRWIAPLGWLDHPTIRKTHLKATPITGGMALWIGCNALLAAGLIKLPLSWAEWVLINGFALLGALDDRLDLSAKMKARTTFLLALGLALSHALQLQQGMAVTVFLGIPIPTNPMYTIPLLVLWFWAIPQTLNLIDGSNGLAIGTSLVILFRLMPFWPDSASSATLAGGLLALFVLNWPRSHHFLGDCGALFLGALLAVLTFKTVALPYPTLALWLFAYPILDTCLVVATRWRLGRPVIWADRNHLHHHWADLLGPRLGWLVPVILWSQAALLGFRAIRRPPWDRIAWIGLTFLLIQIFLFHLKAVRNRQTM